MPLAEHARRGEGFLEAAEADDALDLGVRELEGGGDRLWRGQAAGFGVRPARPLRGDDPIVPGEPLIGLQADAGAFGPFPHLGRAASFAVGAAEGDVVVHQGGEAVEVAGVEGVEPRLNDVDVGVGVGHVVS